MHIQHGHVVVDELVKAIEGLCRGRSSATKESRFDLSVAETDAVKRREQLSHVAEASERGEPLHGDAGDAPNFVSSSSRFEIKLEGIDGTKGVKAANIRLV